jgi:hypothetical protein
MDRQKFKHLVHYIISSRRHDPDSLGAIKLNKILWLSDLRAYHQTGESITGARYIKREFGPVPASVMPVLHELEVEGSIRIREAPHYGKQKTEYVDLSPVTSDYFLQPVEIEIVRHTIDEVCDRHTAKSISEASHDHVWEAAADGEEIPHYTVFARPGVVAPTDIQWAQIMLEGESATESQSK